MNIKVTLRGSLQKKFGYWKKKDFEVPDNCNIREAMIAIDLHPDKIDNLGMVVINGCKTTMDAKLSPGDELKIWSRVTGG